MVKIVGVDYGAKMSGNTVVAHFGEDGIHFLQAEKKKDADKWLIQILQRINPQTIYLDAPLSLPAAYYGKPGSFHFREADTLTGAMSPMFLGGLTARAISLKHALKQYAFVEVYPAFFQAQMVRSTHYKKNIKAFLKDLMSQEPFELADTPSNWHQVDALIALLIGKRHQGKRHQEMGNRNEGIIII